MFLALELKSPMVLMCSFNPASPSASIASGVSTFEKLLVALFTPTSVAWADKTTATSGVDVDIFQFESVPGWRRGVPRKRIECGLFHS